MSDQPFRISFQVIAFSKGAPVSPARIEERVQRLLTDIVFDNYDTDNPQGEVFGYVQNLSVTRND